MKFPGPLKLHTWPFLQSSEGLILEARSSKPHTPNLPAAPEQASRLVKRKTQAPGLEVGPGSTQDSNSPLSQPQVTGLRRWPCTGSFRASSGFSPSHSFLSTGMVIWERTLNKIILWVYTSIIVTTLSLQLFWLHFVLKSIYYKAIFQIHCQLQTFANK